MYDKPWQPTEKLLILYDSLGLIVSCTRYGHCLCPLPCVYSLYPLSCVYSLYPLSVATVLSTLCIHCPVSTVLSPLPCIYCLSPLSCVYCLHCPVSTVCLHCPVSTVSPLPCSLAHVSSCRYHVVHCCTFNSTVMSDVSGSTSDSLSVNNSGILLNFRFTLDENIQRSLKQSGILVVCLQTLNRLRVLKMSSQ